MIWNTKEELPQTNCFYMRWLVISGHLEVWVSPGPHVVPVVNSCLLSLHINMLCMVYYILLWFNVRVDTYEAISDVEMLYYSYDGSMCSVLTTYIRDLGIIRNTLLLYSYYWMQARSVGRSVADWLVNWSSFIEHFLATEKLELG